MKYLLKLASFNFSVIVLVFPLSCVQKVQLPKATKADKVIIKDAYLAAPFYSDISKVYFLGLRSTKIDIRDHLKNIIKPDWSSLTGPGLNSYNNLLTCDYFLYLASLGEGGAIQSIEKKLRTIKSGNDLTNLLKSLSHVKNEEVRMLIDKFKNDQRHADGPSGPGMKVSDTVKHLLAN